MNNYVCSLPLKNFDNLLLFFIILQVTLLGKPKYSKMTLSPLTILVLSSTFFFVLLIGQFLLRKQINQLITRLEERQKLGTEQQESLQRLLKEQQKENQEIRERFDAHQLSSLKILQDTLQKGMLQNSETLNKNLDRLTHNTDQRLKEISGQVEKRLSEGFEKTTNIFHDVLKRLALIDEAQKKITELSGNVISLQEVLADKRSRGAFGEVQLVNLIRNVMPEQSFALQHTLSNAKRVDCILFLPPPTGHVAIDAKFPLESYRKLSDIHLIESERQMAERQFKKDVIKHIQDIASKYIIQGETSDGAVMFIPAEAVFAEIHAHHPDIVEIAQKAKVWLVSPTTLMAILTTARAVLKDEATKKQVHIIQEHLVNLSIDFERFQNRMDDLARHIDMAHKDVEQVHKSSQKITSRFSKIEKVELTEK